MNSKQILLAEMLAKQSVSIQAEYRRYSAHPDESGAWDQLMATAVRVAHKLGTQVPGTVADLSGVDSRVYWLQVKDGHASICSAGISDDGKGPMDDVRMLEDIEGLSASELLEIAANLDKWLNRPVMKQLGQETLDAEFQAVYGAST